MSYCGRKPSKAQLDKAVRTFQIYHGACGYVRARDEERLFKRAEAVADRIAKRMCVEADAVWSELAREARKRGSIRPIVGKDF